MAFIAWHDRTLSMHLSLTSEYQSQGFGFISLSVYGATSAPYYAAVMIQPAPAPQHHYPSVPGNQWQQLFDSEAAQGYGPVIIAATGSASSPTYAAVFEPQNPIPLTRNGLGSGQSNDPNTIQGMDAQAKSQGLIPRWVASYGDSSNPAFAAVWIPNPGQTLWNNDGVFDSAAGYQSRFDAETSAWCRVPFVTLNQDQQYFSLFVDNQIGAWQGRHNMNSAGYQAQFNTLTQQGYYPICVQAAGPVASTATFAAIFVKSPNVVPKTFTATGPVANAQIDAVVEQLMQQYVVRHAALGIVHKTKLVYARGYTLAEPGWPLAQPTTCFRLASVSKTPTAIAIYQLIQAGTLSLGETLQSILKLNTPSGGAPSDSRFSQITIQQLLEHTSGLNPGGTGGFDDGVAVRNAFNAAGHPSTLPVSAAMTDSYIASLSLVTNPGATQVYNNCGYYLLARVVAKLRNQNLPIDAYQQHLFNPLSITRIRRAVSLLANQPGDEARYQDYDLIRYQSQMSQTQPLVADVYGNVQLEIMEGSGGLTGAATDVARLIAALIWQKDNPAIKRATLTSMLTAAASLAAAHPGWRAGYGLDGANSLGSGEFYGQKGGLLDSSSSVLQFKGDWGFTMLWGSGRAGQLPNQSWYPDFRAVMNIAEGVNWGSADLFPQFGMPSFWLPIRGRAVRFGVSYQEALMRHLLILLASTTVAGFGQSSNKCADLTKFQMPGSKIEIARAEMVAAGRAAAGRGGAAGPELPAHCRVNGIIGRRTGPDGKTYGIRFAVALPENWTGQYLQHGGGGLNGTVAEPTGAQADGDRPALARGFAVATSDTGHESAGGAFDGSFMQDQQAALDFEWVAIGRLAVVAKQIIETYYGRPPAHSYYVGCSTGGREAMLMSQRYPLYFDGVVSGSPAMRTGYSNLATRSVTVALNAIAPKDANGHPGAALSDSDKKAVIAKLLEVCDARDGAKDGMIFDVLGCTFRPRDLQCSGAKADGCLSPDQVAAIEKGFGGPKDSRGKQVYPGFFYDTGIAAQGGGIPGLLNPGPSPVGGPTTNTAQDVDAEAAVVDNNPTSRIGDSYTWVNLNSFSSHGGKLIFYHGVSDPWFSAKDTIDYYQRMTAANGGESKVKDWSRLFLSPGMGHCGGGSATLDTFDMLSASVNWVEQGQAPESVTATGRAFPGRSRPLCAFPAHAQYKGQGSMEDAGNFECRQ